MMVVLINHAVAIVTSPLSVAMIALTGGLALFAWGRMKIARIVMACGIVWLWFMSCGWTYAILGGNLERMYPPRRVEDMAVADAIVVLGGGVGGNTNVCPYAEMYWSADRVAHAARLWKVDKAPVIVISGNGEVGASYQLLQEFGVPRQAIVVENEARNTEENAKFVCRLLAKAGNRRPRVLLVTSAWHMRRALLVFQRYALGLEVVPAAADYEVTIHSGGRFDLSGLLPSAEALDKTSYMLKEYIGYWGYRLLRR